MGNTLTWTMGRQLASFGNISYAYNEDGIRTSKTSNGVTTKFYLDGTNIIEQTDGTTTLYFFYDSVGEIVGFKYNDSNYLYVKNSMGDIVGIADAAGNLIASYTYDAWGKVTSVTGSNTAIGELNPFRYRSYYYDSDIQLYYLQSRYYDPEIGRFINSDDVHYLGITETDVSYNAFAYCENNPINNFDESGNASIPPLLGFGFQLYLNIASIACGVEVVWYNSRVKTKGYGTPCVYFFAEGTCGRNGNSLKNLLKEMTKKPTSIFKGGKIFKGFSFSICFFAIFGDKSFKNPRSYEGIFKTVSATVKRVKGYVSTSSPVGCTSVGFGASNTLFSVSASVSYYWLISGNYGVFSSLRSKTSSQTNGIKYTV